MELKADQVEISTVANTMQRHSDNGAANAVDPDNYFSDPARDQRINLLLHLIHYADLLLLSSAEGSGKSTVLASFVERMGDGWQIHQLQGAALAQETSLSNRLADIFGSAGDGHADRVQHLLNHIPRLRRLSKPIILVIDDAEKLTVSSMQLLDKMLAAGDSHGKPVHLILSGRPELDDMIAAPGLAGLQDRVAHRLDIPPFSESTSTQFIQAYVEKIEPDKKALFNASVIKRIYRRAEGYPGQMISEIADALNESNMSKASDKPSSVLPTIDLFDKNKAKNNIKALYSRPLIFGAIALGVALAVMGVLRFSADDAAVTVEVVKQIKPMVVSEPETSILNLSAPVVEPIAPEVVVAVPASKDEPPIVETLVEDEQPEVAELVPAPVVSPEASPPIALVPELEVIKEIAVPIEELAAEPDVAPAIAVVEPVAAPPSSNFAKRDEWLLKQDPNYFTLQLMAANNEPGVLQYIEGNGLTDSVAYFFSERDGNPWYAVTYGSYPSRSAANSVTLPPVLSGTKPWVRTFGGIHNAIRAAR